jgi:nicotinate phosphoribosyltransferase
MVDPMDTTHRKKIPACMASEDLLVPVISRGQRAGDLPSLKESRDRLQMQLGMFHTGIKRFVNPHRYPVGLELGLHERKTNLIHKARGFEP